MIDAISPGGLPLVNRNGDWYTAYGQPYLSIGGNGLSGNAGFTGVGTYDFIGQFIRSNSGSILGGGFDVNSIPGIGTVKSPTKSGLDWMLILTAISLIISVYVAVRD